MSATLAEMLRKSTTIYNDRWVQQTKDGFKTEPKPETVALHNRYWDAIVRAVESSDFDELMAFARDAGRFQARMGYDLSDAVGRTVDATNMIELALLEANDGQVPPIQIVNELAELRSMIVIAVADGYRLQLDVKAPERVVVETAARQQLRSLLVDSAKPQTIVNLGAGDEIAPLYEGGMVFHFVDYGKLRVYNLLPNGRCITVSILGPSDVFFQWRTESQSLSCVCAEAMDDTRVVSVSERDLADLVAKQPTAALEMMTNFARRLAESQVLIEDLMNNSVNLRLYRTLLELTKQFGKADGTAKVIDYPLTHQRLADMIGSNRVTVTRKLHDLQERGIVGTRKNAMIVVLNEAALLALSTAGSEN